MTRQRPVSKLKVTTHVEYHKTQALEDSDVIGYCVLVAVFFTLALGMTWALYVGGEFADPWDGPDLL